MDSYNGTVDATDFGDQCIQQAFVVPPGVPPEVIQDIVPFLSLFSVNPNVTQSEDCKWLAAALSQSAS